jgi:hypothetical protein
VFYFLKVFEYFTLSGICSIIAVVFPALFCLSFTDGCILSTIAGCIPVNLFSPVIVKGENPGVLARNTNICHPLLINRLVVNAISCHCTCSEK